MQYCISSGTGDYTHEAKIRLLQFLTSNGISYEVGSIYGFSLDVVHGAYHHPSKSKELIKHYNKYFQNLDSFDFDTKSAITYAQLRNTLTTTGSLIADMDLIIASICIVNKLILVTHNTKDFAKIKELTIEDWTT